jgi:ABC-type cobalamin/Fe3+-siderophores transport system ATPase subunit
VKDDYHLWLMGCTKYFGYLKDERTMFKFKIDSIEFNSGDIIEVEENSLTILIGPNSAGKSTSLREIQTALQGQSNQLVLKSCKINKEGTEKDFEGWLEKNYPSRIKAGGTKCFFTKGQELPLTQIQNSWNNINRSFHFFCSYLDTKSRLQIASTKQAINPYEQTPSEFIHILQTDSELAKEISEEINQSFENEIIINWGGAGQVWFNVGKEPKGENPVSSEYLRELNKLPRLDNDGDGIQSFTGCLLSVKCGSHPVLLIDEPEAFLHPPQARRLGRILAESAKKLKRQIIIATHSSEIIQGALSTQGKVSVCRITRKDKTNHASLFKSKELKALWSKPMLQSSGAIDGIFHKGVIVCEADADCRFYETLLRQKEIGKELSKPADLYFIHGGGKGEISTLSKSYSSLKVSCIAIADFDLLRNKSEFKKLFEILGGNFSDVEKIFKSSINGLNDLKQIKNIKDFVKEIRQTIDNIESENKISNANKKIISNLLSESSDWSIAKKFGIRKLKGGNYKDCEELLTKCKSIGLFIIPFGELESWWNAGPSDKSEWVLDALKEIAVNRKTFVEADKFLDEICGHFGIK